MENCEPKKELILINPVANGWTMAVFFAFFFPRSFRSPIAFQILSALTPKDYKIKIYNRNLFLFKKKIPKGSLIGIACTTLSSYNAYQLADHYRKAGCYVVMGGAHVRVLPEEALNHCHSVVIGEAESVWPEVIKDFENKSLKRIYEGKPLEDFFSPVEDYFFNIDPKILWFSGLSLSRGCKYRCDFCACLPSKPRYLRIDQIVKMVSRIKESIKFPYLLSLFPISFMEDNIFSNPKNAKEVFKALIPLKIKWISMSSLDIAFDDEALRLAKESGCVGLALGFETIHPEKYQKSSLPGISSSDDYIRAIRNIRSYGINVFGLFMLGFDDYTHKDYFKLWLFIIKAHIKSRIYYVALTILMPFPGTQLFKRLQSEGRITSCDWRKYDMLFGVVFKPKNTSKFSLLLWANILRATSFFLSPFMLIFLFFGGIIFVQLLLLRMMGG
ncbi:MAG: radical SAM protein [Candidatus Omnitrophica bacterium]|nr:radical SAM protein [Candidatus Omnitrophota bacterium]